ncbi:MAG: hypothetical protein SOY48_09130 [Eubacterium sp.]|nr:hypothetical protein [Eubacterium sp.]MDY4111026.1 hypothetical protein [Eubacterium sp.]
MKKIISALLAVTMVVTMAFGFASCSSKEYKDTDATVPVTNEQGETVTDKNGEAVTELSTESKKNDDSSTASSKSETSSTSAKKTENAKEKESNKDKTTKKASSTKKAQTTKKAETTTKETTTEKPEKREVSVSVAIPTYRQVKDAKLTIKYKTEKDKEYQVLKMDDPNDKKNKLDYEVVKLDGKTVKTYSLGKIKGDVKVKVSLSGIDLTGNTATVKSNESSVTISPATGIDIVNGKFD